MPQQRNTPITCVLCGKTALTTPRDARKQKYCSLECTRLARRGKYFGERATANRICEVCSRPFHAKQVHINAGIARFCSGRCRGVVQQIPLTIPGDTESLIYMAGIVDGEGTITVDGEARPRIIVANSSVVLMEWIAETFGGRLHRQRTRSPKHKPVMVWYMGAEQSVALCRLLMPYLKIKRRQAEIVLAVGEATVYQRAIFTSEMRSINRRGV